MKKSLCTWFLVLFQTALLYSLDVPLLAGHPVHDDAHILSDEAISELEAFILELDQTTDVQVGVLTIQSLEGETIEDYSIKVAEKWQLGSKDKDTGILVLVTLEEREIRIEVGYGLESTLTDAICGKIIRKVIVPAFSQGDYDSGIIDVVKSFYLVISEDEEFLAELAREDKGDGSAAIIIAMVGLVVACTGIGIVAAKNGGRGGSYSSYSPSRSRSSGSSRRSFSSRSSFSGRGGSFGGGGASGRW